MRHAVILMVCIATSAPASDFTDISPAIEAILVDSPVPSLAAAAVVEGRIVSVGASGFRKKGAPERVTVSDKYHIGSCTKSMTAVLAAMLVEQGQLKWETTVSEVFRGIDVHPGYDTVTLSQLLTNTGGVPGEVEPTLWAELWQAQGSVSAQRLKLATGILTQPPGYEAGTKYEYSNGGFSVAGAMLERVMGEHYEDMLTRLLFDRLAMKSAGFRAPAQLGQVDQPYGHSQRELRVVPVDPEPAGDNPAAIGPAGSVHCSVIDFARYAQFHLGVVGEGLLSVTSRDRLHSAPAGRDYAMGWVVTRRDWAGGTALTHAGSNTMFYAVIWIAPERQFAAVAMCNYGGKEAPSTCDRVIAFLIDKYCLPAVGDS